MRSKILKIAWIGGWLVAAAGTSRAADFTISGATWTFSNDFVFTTTRTITITSGQLIANGSRIDVGTGWSASQNAFQAGSSTVTFNASATISGQTTFANLYANLPAATLTFQSDSTQTVSGTLTLQGSVGQGLNLRASSPGTRAYLTSTGARNVSSLNVQDNDASGGPLIDAGASSIDSGNNVNWRFSGPVNPTIQSVFVSSATVGWAAAPQATGYVLEASTASNFSGTLISSTTTNPLQVSLSFNTGSLAANTTYYMRVGGVTPSTVNYTNTTPISTATLTVPLTSAFSQVYLDSMTVSWATLAPLGSAGYRVQVSTAPDFSGPINESSTADVNITSVNVFGLIPDTVYYARAGGINWNGRTNYSVIGSTRTDAPDYPTGFVGTALGTTSITWNWNAVSGATAYRIYLATSPTTLVAQVAVSSYTEVNLSTNTAYGRVLSTLFGVTESSLSPAATTYTLAAPPQLTSATAVFVSSFAFSWNTNGNPVGTTYRGDYSTDPLFGSFVSTTVTTTPALATGLFANTTYYVRSSAFNGDGLQTGYSNSASTITLPNTPTSGNLDSVSDNSFRITWQNAGNNPSTIYQAEVSTISFVGASTSTILTTALQATFTGLQTNTTYYARVRANGFSGVDSSFLLVGSTVPTIGIPANPRFTVVLTTQATVAWDGVTGGSTEYVAELASSDPFAPPQISTTPGLTSTFVNLSTNTIYYARIRTHNSVSGNFSAYSAIASTYTLATAPINFSTTSVLSTSVSMSWQAGDNPTGTRYEIERSTDGVLFSLRAQQTLTSYTDTGLTASMLYYYRVRALNGNDIPTSYATLSVTTLSINSTVPPKTVCAFSGTFNSPTQLLLSWNDVTLRTDGSALSNLSGYEVFQATSPTTPKTSWTFLGTTTVSSTTVTVNPISTRYYALRAYDSLSNRSDWSITVEDTADLAHIAVADDNSSMFRVPISAATRMNRTNNSFGTDICLAASTVSSEEGSRVIRSLRFDIMRWDTGASVPTFAFEPSVAQGILRYSISAGEVSIGAPHAPSFATGILPTEAASRLSLFWNNGNQWVKTTAQIDQTDQTVRFTSSRAGRYQIRIATHNGLSLTQVYPRIFSPNGDGWNDKVIFMFDNPDAAALDGEIFDITGSKVSTLVEGPVPNASLSWDGKDSGGRTVPGGIYIYQIDLKGKPVTGTVVVAR